jgi:hypothetical protein
MREIRTSGSVRGEREQSLSPTSTVTAPDAEPGRCAKAIATLGHLFLGGAAPACADAADAGDSGELDITDAVYGLGFQFLGGPAPPSPGPAACGEDPTDDDLPACAYDPARC